MNENDENTNDECDHEWSLGSCAKCGAECPDGCEEGFFSEDRYSYGPRNEGHYTVESPCTTCNPKACQEYDFDDVAP